VSDHHAGIAVETRQATDDALVIGEVAIAMHLGEVGENFRDIVERVRAIGMARDLGDLPGREAAIDVLGQLQALLGELPDLFGNVDRALAVHVAQFLDFGFKLRNRLLEIQEGFFCQVVLSSGGWHRPCPPLAGCSGRQRIQ